MTELANAANNHAKTTALVRFLCHNWSGTHFKLAIESAAQAIEVSHGITLGAGPKKKGLSHGAMPHKKTIAEYIFITGPTTSRFDKQ